MSNLPLSFSGLSTDYIQLSDEWADIQMPVDGTTGCLRAFAQLKPKYPKLKLILSIGGAGKGSENFSRVARSQSCMETFGRTARALVDEYGLDGVDGKLISFCSALSNTTQPCFLRNVLATPC